MTTPDQMKVAIAKSIAVNGSQGPAMMKAGQGDLGAQQQGALDAASSRAGLINAPDAFLKEQATQLSEPYNTAATKNAADTAALNNYMGSLSAANGNYLGQLRAAIPLAQAQVDKSQSGANLSQLMQLLNFKNAQEDRAYALQQRQLTQDKQDKEKTNLATQQKAFSLLLNNPNVNFRDTGIDIINQSKDLPSALAALGSIKDNDLQKNGVSRDDLRRTLIQYYDPETFSQLPTPVAPAATPTATQAAPTQGGSNWFENLNSTINPFSGGFRKKLGNSLRAGY